MTDAASPGHIGFFASARSGLGHLQRVGNIASALRRQGFAGRLSLLCNADVQGLSTIAARALDNILVLERDDMATEARRICVSLAVSDMMVVPGLAKVGSRQVLILRETPDDRLGAFALGPAAWDMVLVPNPASHWAPDLPADFAKEVVRVGWIVRQTGRRGPLDKSAGIILATGGGGTRDTRDRLYPVLSRILDRARKQVTMAVTQALGPRAVGQALSEVDRVIDPGSGLNDVFRCADIVISTAGYNSVLELAGTDTPTLLTAIPRSYDDQQARVRHWGPLLGHGLDPEGEDAAADWLIDQVRHPRRRSPVDLGADGAAGAAAILARLK
ncbi:hypothetical protein [Primorskyibacter sp. 2E233]|uniref:hypothetical protein n=1 Tax=Primorskyibacter sp. 2E233 TaxID=3413431 RepID=UPI003BF39A86